MYGTYSCAGSLASSLLDPSVCLVGASGGVYSLLAGHMAHLLLNYSAVQWGPARIVALIALASIEVNFIYVSYYTDPFLLAQQRYIYAYSCIFLQHLQ
jgi:hypothetical protein